MQMTLDRIVEFQDQQIKKDGRYPMDSQHQFNHVVKALGPVATFLEQTAHGEQSSLEEKRLADLIICTVWLSRSLGFDPDTVVAHRIADIEAGRK